MYCKGNEGYCKGRCIVFQCTAGRHCWKCIAINKLYCNLGNNTGEQYGEQYSENFGIFFFLEKIK